jgi:mannose-6-phosphate isomerase
MSELSPNLLDLDRFAVDVKRIEKPWGYELVWATTDRYCAKLLFVKAGESLSLQFHRRKDETIYVHSGRMQFEMGDPGKPVDTEVVGPGRSFHLPPGTVHRLHALDDTVLLEASTPETDDVVRLEDRYGRADVDA